MRRRTFIGLLGAAMAADPLPARALRPETMRRIGVLIGAAEGDSGVARDQTAFRAALQELGWTEGRNIRFDYRWAAGDADRAQTYAAELTGLSPDVLVGSSTIATQALHRATTTVPIVFVNVTDPVAGGFVASLARPGGNITGFTPFEYEIGGKWLELLKEMAPHVTRVAMLGDPNNHNFIGFRRSFENAAKLMGVEPASVAIRGADDVELGIRSVADGANGGIIITAATFSFVHRDLIVRLANTYKLPTISWNRAHVMAGGLMSFGPDSVDLNRRSATYVDRILKGDKPGDLPVQVPTKTEFIVNAKAARAIDLAIPPALLARADEVIE